MTPVGDGKLFGKLRADTIHVRTDVLRRLLWERATLWTHRRSGGAFKAVLDAMKMHNLIRAPRAATIGEVCVEAGQAVGHGDALVL